MGECFFWYQPTWVVPDKGRLNSCVCSSSQGRIYSKRGPCSEKKWEPLIYEYPVTPPPTPDCLHPTLSGPTRTVVIIDILLRTCAAMHTTTAAAANWQFEASHSEANCKAVCHTKSFPLFPNHYFNISGLLPCCKKMKQFFCPFVGAPVRPNMPKSTSGSSSSSSYSSSVSYILQK